MKKCFLLLALVTGILFFNRPVFSQSATPAKLDLQQLLDSKKIKVVNRTATKLKDGTYQGIHLDEKPNDGIAWIEGSAFSGGTIECDIRGKDVFQQSFVGIAFYPQDEQTYEAIYFRPFNFRAQDSLRRIHAVQYIFHPQYNWNKLRSEYPEVYENPVEPAPDPSQWFHVRIVVESPMIRVFVNDAKEPTLEVKQLSKNTGGKIGLWVGNNSAGDFANLTIKPAKNIK